MCIKRVSLTHELIFQIRIRGVIYMIMQAKRDYFEALLKRDKEDIKIK
jgi:hypothetical protein